MLMVVGLKAVISREVETITKAKLKEMDGISKQVTTLARKLVNDELVPSFYSELNYRRALKELAAGFQIEQVVEMTKKFPAKYQVTGSALIIKAKEVVEQLLAGYPVSQYVTLAGSVELLPADAKLFKFISILEVLDNPLMVFSLMSTGALLKTQANAVRVVYPTLSAAIDAAILQATMTAKSAKKSFELPFRAEYGVKAWFGKGPVTTKQLQAAQAIVAKSNAKKAAAAAPPPQNAPAQPSLMSNTQRVESAA